MGTVFALIPGGEQGIRSKPEDAQMCGRVFSWMKVIGMQRENKILGSERTEMTW